MIHETNDPEFIVAEFEYHRVTDNGQPYALPAIFVRHVRNGKIVSSRDYHDHLATGAWPAGRLDLLFTALSVRNAAFARTDAQA